MVRNRWLIVMSLTILATVSINSSERNANGLLHNFQGLFQSAIKWYLNDNTRSVQGVRTRDLSTVLKETSIIKFDEKPIDLDGSLDPHALTPSSISRRAVKHSAVRDERQNGCTCQVVAPAINCSVTCTSFEIRCGLTCTVYSYYTCTHFFTNGVLSLVQDSFEVDYGPDCPGLPCVTLSTTTTTTTTTTLTTCPFPAASAVLVAVAGIAVGVGIGISATPTSVIVGNDLVDISTIEPVRIIGEETPVNNLDIPVLEIRNFPDDGCENNSARFNFGDCTQLLRRGSCPNPYQWVTAHPVSLQVNELELKLQLSF